MGRADPGGQPVRTRRLSRAVYSRWRRSAGNGLPARMRTRSTSTTSSSTSATIPPTGGGSPRDGAFRARRPRIRRSRSASNPLAVLRSRAKASRVLVRKASGGAPRWRPSARGHPAAGTLPVRDGRGAGCQPHTPGQSGAHKPFRHGPGRRSMIRGRRCLPDGVHTLGPLRQISAATHRS